MQSGVQIVVQCSVHHPRCHPERNEVESRDLRTCSYIYSQIGAKILRLATLTQDDMAGSLCDKLEFTAQFLIQAHGSGNAQGFGPAQLLLQSLRRIEEGKPDRIGRYFRNAPAQEHRIEPAAFLPVRRCDGAVSGARWGDGDGLLLHRHIQPDLPALPGEQIFRQRDVEGAGGQKNGTGRIVDKTRRRCHGAGEGLKQGVGSVCGISIRFPFEIQQYTRSLCCPGDPRRIKAKGEPVIQDRHGSRGQRPFRRQKHPRMPGQGRCSRHFLRPHGKI